MILLPQDPTSPTPPAKIQPKNTGDATKQANQQPPATSNGLTANSSPIQTNGSSFAAEYAAMLDTDPLLRKADVAIRLYAGWAGAAGQAQADKLNVRAIVQSNRHACSKLYKQIYIEELKEILKNPEESQLLEFALRHPVKYAPLNRVDPLKNEYATVLSSEEISQLLSAPEQFPAESVDASSLMEPFTSAFREWYREGIRAGIYTAISDNYIAQKTQHLRSRHLSTTKTPPP